VDSTFRSVNDETMERIERIEALRGLAAGEDPGDLTNLHKFTKTPLP
jgi:hypothetical protein